MLVMFLAGIAGGTAAVRENGVGVLAAGYTGHDADAYVYLYWAPIESARGALNTYRQHPQRTGYRGYCYQLEAC